MTTKPRQAIAKPGAKNRFAEAKEFAQNDSPAEDTTAPSKKAAASAETVRVNWDCDADTKQELDLFVVNSRKFKTRREALNQFLKDGLEKYKGQ